MKMFLGVTITILPIICAVLIPITWFVYINKADDHVDAQSFFNATVTIPLLRILACYLLISATRAIADGFFGDSFCLCKKKIKERYNNRIKRDAFIKKHPEIQKQREVLNTQLNNVRKYGRMLLDTRVFQLQSELINSDISRDFINENTTKAFLEEITKKVPLKVPKSGRSGTIYTENIIIDAFKDCMPDSEIKRKDCLDKITFSLRCMSQV